MFKRNVIQLPWVLTMLLAAGLASPARGQEPKTIRIGLARSLYRDTPASLVRVIAEPFATLMEAQTGIPGQLVPAAQADDLAKELKAGKFQLGLFQGVEFAWAQQSYPELKPLMIAINKRLHLQACMVVRSDSSVTRFADLGRKTIAVPRHSREHCSLFLEHCCAQQHQEVKHYFASIVGTGS